jgi:hypothetical protein
VPLITLQTYQNIRTANPGHVTELENMGLISDAGMKQIRGPILNGADSGNPRLGWGNNVTVYARFTAPQTGFPAQVWYKIGIIGSGYDGLWIVARYEGEDYVQGGDTVCSGLVATPDSISFPYDRRAAANYAIEHSYDSQGIQNSLTQSGHVTRPIRDNQNQLLLPYADFYYSYLVVPPGQTEPPGTGSAVFMSEAIWAGGLPMTVGDPSSCQINPSPTIQEGWRYCEINAGASNPWDFHQQLVPYFTNSQASPDSNFTNNVLGGANKGYQFAFPGGSITKKTDRVYAGRDVAQSGGVVNVTTLDMFPYINELRSGIVNDPSGLGSWMQQAFGYNNQTQLIIRGDYVFIDPAQSSNPGHGLLGYSREIIDHL